MHPMSFQLLEVRNFILPICGLLLPMASAAWKVFAALLQSNGHAKAALKAMKTLLLKTTINGNTNMEEIQCSYWSGITHLVPTVEKPHSSTLRTSTYDHLHLPTTIGSHLFCRNVPPIDFRSAFQAEARTKSYNHT